MIMALVLLCINYIKAGMDKKLMNNICKERGNMRFVNLKEINKEDYAYDDLIYLRVYTSDGDYRFLDRGEVHIECTLRSRGLIGAEKEAVRLQLLVDDEYLKPLAKDYLESDMLW